MTRKQPVTSLLDFSCQLVYSVRTNTRAYIIVFVHYLFIYLYFYPVVPISIIRSDRVYITSIHYIEYNTRSRMVPAKYMYIVCMPGITIQYSE